VIGVHVREEDSHRSIDSRPAQQELALRSFATIEHYQLVLATNEHAGKVAMSRWNASSGSKKDDVKQIA
jgi:hypothetical protein